MNNKRKKLWGKKAAPSSGGTAVDTSVAFDRQQQGEQAMAGGAHQ